ncbi:hypothetical protein OH76DRAFT_544377 [Lentinus brumalis]|uniref:Uncharacterized protein n=1 Tax=Lentinus brumalis TaxID=2498619 RepID=A0A371D9R6_9APHY|nr:hypothetical protein OH76DRAFT_544377 [Polyporus brumalis]
MVLSAAVNDRKSGTAGERKSCFVAQGIYCAAERGYASLQLSPQSAMHLGGIWCDVPAILATRSVLILRLRQPHSCVVLAVYSVDMLTREVCICPSHIPDPHLCSANAPRMLYSGAGLVWWWRPPLVIWTHGVSTSHMACYALVPHVPRMV